MKLLHLADTHLGFSAYRKLTKEGMNQREMDIYHAFTQCVDYAIKTKPDLVLHAGDLFDTVRPTNRAITFALNQLIRLSKHNIPVVIISGNHETPKLTETGSIFTIFEHLDHVYPIYKNSYETHSFTIDNKTITVHAVPHCQTKQGFLDSLKQVTPDDSADRNIFLAHGAVTGIKEFKMNEFNELFIPVDMLSPDFDYIALGHYHNYTKLKENAFYAGSSERLTFSESESKKGCIELDLGSKLRSTFKEIKTRPMIDIPPINCSKKSVEDITEYLSTTISSIKPKDKIFRIKLSNISSSLFRSIDFNQIRTLCSGAVHYEIKSDMTKQGEQQIMTNASIDSIAGEFAKYMKEKDIAYKNLLLQSGLEYIQKFESKDDHT